VKTWTSYLRRTAGRCLMPLAVRAAQSYIAGPELNDALHVTRGLAKRGLAATLGFWDGAGDSPDSVAEHYLAALTVLAQEGCDAYVSIKLPALADSRALLDRVVEQARRQGQRIHFDSLATDAADSMWSAALAAAAAGTNISCSLPGRWPRSLDDAEVAVAAGIVPRVVKGQWADPESPEIDLRDGFLSVVDRLAGRVPHVAIASHDVPLVGEAIRRLRASGTTCELELLYGLPERASLALAGREGIRSRFYVPYGRAYLPYCLAHARRQPRMLWWLMRDAVSRR
jgi:proline dehydrogenase